MQQLDLLAYQPPRAAQVDAAAAHAEAELPGWKADAVVDLDESRFRGSRMNPERFADKALTAQGTRADMKAGIVRVNVRVSEEIFDQIKAIAIVGRRSISGQVRELLKTSLEPR